MNSIKNLSLIFFIICGQTLFAQKNNEPGLKRYTYRAAMATSTNKKPPLPGILQPQMEWVKYTALNPDPALEAKYASKPIVEKKNILGGVKKTKKKKEKDTEEIVGRDSNPDAIDLTEKAKLPEVENINNVENTAYLQKVKVLVDSAKFYLKVPYKTGGVDNQGMDCSGLVMTSYKKIGVTLPRRSIDMSATGTEITDIKSIKKGDLVFFDSNNTGKINHVGMITSVSEKEILFIHASVSAGVVESPLTGKYWKERHKKTVRVL